VSVLFVISAVFWLLLIAAAISDLRAFILPDFLVLPALVLSLAHFFVRGGSWTALLLGFIPCLGLAILAFVLRLVLSKETLGWGDIKLSAALGPMLGLVPLVLAFSLAALTALLTLAVLVGLKRKKWREPVAFGFYLTAAGFIVWLFEMTGGIRFLR